ncbi:pilus assembly protein PilM [Gallionella capsiferriformans]|jgi:type IV pilus assembly protein PilM|uniref:Type IV pilus assembly protein PilM n=1 Tax=Gallionella capsiferriformans (strain ES-2) TaxID=395494 RepID=D9SIE6_GALCS|nr:pilus assembly protein PilM [Gallionella capsiferriformans]ADL54203.1 type IV pilus assembly protein PilM [Gallionella capsiferriformans ES-2]
MPKVNFDFFVDFIQSKAPPLIGVDISSSSVKLVELSQAPNNGGYVVERYVIETLPKDAFFDGNINNLDALADALQRAWKRLGTKIKNISVALPASAVITKKILLPAGMRDEDLEFQVESEANQYIPFALDEVNLDFQVLGPAPGNADEVEVLLAASRKANVEDRVAAAQAAGLKVSVVDVEPYAAEAAFSQIRAQLPDNADDKCVALIDIGATVMNVNVLRNGQSIYTRDQQIGGEQLTLQIQNAFGMTAEQAEVAKRSGDLPANYDSEVLSPFRENLVMEIARALQFFFTSSQHYNEIDYIVLAGGCAVLPGLDDAVATRTQVSTMVANPFALMTLSGKIKNRQLQADAPALIVACGLAMRRFDPS